MFPWQERLGVETAKAQIARVDHITNITFSTGFVRVGLSRFAG